MTAPTTNVLQNWVVQLGYQINAQQQRRFQEAMEAATLRARLLGDAIEQMAVRTVQAFDRVVTSYNELYFAADRTKASVESLTAIGYATKQLGGSAEEAMAVMENLGVKLRNFGTGYEALFRQVGVHTREQVGVRKGELRDTVDLVLEYIKKVRELTGGDYVRARPYLEAIGFTTDRARWAAWNKDFETFVRENEALQDRLFKDRPGGVKKVSEDAHEFAQNMNRVAMIWDNVLKLFMANMIAGGKGPLAEFTKWLEKPENVDKMAQALTNIANAIIELVKALAKLATSETGLNIFKSITRFISTYAETGSLRQAAGEVIWPSDAPKKTEAEKAKDVELFDANRAVRRQQIWNWIKDLFGISSAQAAEGGGGEMPGFMKAFVTGIDKATEALGKFTKLITRWLLDISGKEDAFKAGGGDGGGDGDGGGYKRGGVRYGHHTPGRGGHGGEGGGATGDVAPAGSFKALVDREAAAAGIDPRHLYGILAGESAGSSHKFVVNPDDPSGGAFGPWQMVGGGRLGSQFQRDTGLDWRKAENIPAMTRYAARKVAWLLKHGRSIHGIWHGYAGPRNWGKGWGEFGYKGDPKGETHEPPQKGKTAPPDTKPALPAKTAPPDTSSENERMKKKLFTSPEHVHPDPNVPGGTRYYTPPLRPSSPPLSLAAPPMLGHYATYDRSLHMSPTNNITVHGVSDPGRAADMIAANMDRVNADLTREAISVIS